MSIKDSLPPITLVIGGARSGKSEHAELLVAQSGLSPFYLATATAGDGEMMNRIIQHQKRRGDKWQTVEEPVNLVTALKKASSAKSAVLVDCLTLWLSNLMALSRDIECEMRALTAALPSLTGPVVFVTNEVGLGIVPANSLAREFRDHAGQLNQAVAFAADHVTMMVSGLPMTLKSELENERPSHV